MRTSTAKQVRALLRDHPDGLTIRRINDVLNRTETNMRRVLREMPDAYIDRWDTRMKNPAAVWCVVVPPEDCPRPNT